MPNPYNEAVSIAEFLRMLAFVLVGFGLALALSWSIDAVMAQQATGLAPIHI